MKELFKGQLFKNVFYLYLLTFSGYVLQFVTVPVVARAFGPELYGQLAFSMSFVTYFQIVIDFGFMLSATEKISRCREDLDEVSRIYTSVLMSKLALAVVSALVFMCLVMFVQPFSNAPLLNVLFFINTLCVSFMPDFVFRGMENMKVISIRALVVRIITAGLIVLFVREREHYLLMPIIYIVGNATALVMAFLFAHKKICVRLVRSGRKRVRQEFFESIPFFLSRVAVNIYGATNVFIAGLVYGSQSAALGNYTSADKISVMSDQIASPVFDSLYPYMVKSKNYKLAKRIAFFTVPIVVVFGILGYIFAENICLLLFGPEFSEAYIYLRILIPAIGASLISTFVGYPILTPVGLSKYVNYSNIFGMLLQIAQIAILFAVGKVSIVALCIATVVTKFAQLLFRVIVILKNRAEFR